MEEVRRPCVCFMTSSVCIRGEVICQHLPFCQAVETHAIVVSLCERLGKLCMLHSVCMGICVLQAHVTLCACACTSLSLAVLV